MTAREAVETLLRAGQLRLDVTHMDGRNYQMQSVVAENTTIRPVLWCVRSNKEITLENVRTLQAEHYPIRHKHGGKVDPKNALLSLAEGHKEQTRREAKADAKEDRIRTGRKVMADLDAKAQRSKRRRGKPTGFRWKKPIGGGRPVKVPTYD